LPPPRRPQHYNNYAAEPALSALDRRNWQWSGTYQNGDATTDHDMTIAKNISIKKRRSAQVPADRFNALNRPQYTVGNSNSIRLRSTAASASRFIPANPWFGHWNQVFSSNSRVVQLTDKFLFKRKSSAAHGILCKRAGAVLRLKMQ
jgi:hypothetical protein